MPHLEAVALKIPERTYVHYIGVAAAQLKAAQAASEATYKQAGAEPLEAARATTREAISISWVWKGSRMVGDVQGNLKCIACSKARQESIAGRHCN